MKSVPRVLFLVATALFGVPTLATAQQAVLYEVTENAQVTYTGGLFGRHAYAALQGWAKVGTPICPQAVLVANPDAETCTITAIGTDNVSLVTGKGTISGTWSTVIQFDNPVDAPEATVMTGTFSGEIDLSPVLTKVAPLGLVTNGQFTIDGAGYSFPFSGTFRLPFATDKGKRVHPRKKHDAFYLADDGTAFPVKMDEWSLGWPTVRFDVKFQ
jgi:hypothetical protein